MSDARVMSIVTVALLLHCYIVTIDSFGDSVLFIVYCYITGPRNYSNIVAELLRLCKGFS